MSADAAIPPPTAWSRPAFQLRISVLIPVLNDADGLSRCLNSIRGNGYPADRLEVIVADNGSTDGSREVGARAGVRVVDMPGLPVAAVRNRLAELSTGDVLAFVDADHELAAGWFQSAVETLRRPGVFAVGAPYHAPIDGTWVQRLYDGFRARAAEASDTRWLGSGNLAVWAAQFRSIEGFDTSLVTCEDVDFCQRLRLSGGKLIADERLRSIHHGDPRTLRQLFASELWRGRDNLKVSLRVRPELRDLPSIAVPIATLCCLAALPLGAVAAAYGKVWPLVGVFAAVVAPSAARATAMKQRLGPQPAGGWMRAFAVAATYDLARALAIVVRKGHRRAR